MPTNEFFIKPLKVKLLAEEQKATEVGLERAAADACYWRGGASKAGTGKYIHIYIYILTPPAQAADITSLLSYLHPFGIVPLPPFPSKIFAPLSLLIFFPPFPSKAFPPPPPPWQGRMSPMRRRAFFCI